MMDGDRAWDVSSLAGARLDATRNKENKFVISLRFVFHAAQIHSGF